MYGEVYAYLCLSTCQSVVPACDVDSVARLESFRALKFSKFESFRALKFSSFESFRGLKLSILESFRMLGLKSVFSGSDYFSKI